MHSKTDGKEKPNWIWMTLKALLVVAQLVVLVMLMVSIISLGVLESWIVALVGIGLLLLLVLNIVFLIIRWKTALWGQIICAIIASLVIAGGILAMRYTAAFNSFLGRVTEKKPESKEYSVLVLDDSPVKEVGQLGDKGVGFLKTDPTAEIASKKLQEIVKVDANTYDGINIMNEMMDNDLLDAIVLETSRIEALKQDVEAATEDKRIIYSFTIELPSEGSVETQKEITKEPFLIYISGIDSRNGFQDASLSDVNIVVAVNPGKGKILLASVPRDTYVQLHGTTGLKDKLTHAGWYGLNMSKNTIEDLLSIQIDHTIKVSFDAVVKIVDELGGIEINSDTALNLKSGLSNKICSYVEGKQWIDGECALRFARERKSYNTGDLHRGANQQEVLTGIINKLSGSKDYLLRLPEILDVAADYMDTSLTQEEITSFIRLQFAEQINWKVESIAVDGQGDRLPTYSMGEDTILYVMHPDAESVQQVTDKINEYLKT